MHYELAQINIARFLRPIDDPVNADFVANLALVNTRAEAQPGFIWRLVGNGGDATDIQAYPDPAIIVNMSVWTDTDALAAFVYREPAHRAIMRRRREWFEHREFFMALWWVPAGHRPSIAEGKERITRLERLGSTEGAFLFHEAFPPPDHTALYQSGG